MQPLVKNARMLEPFAAICRNRLLAPVIYHLSVGASRPWCWYCPGSQHSTAVGARASLPRVLQEQLQLRRARRINPHRRHHHDY
jgi:hypothetical protein